MRDTTSLMEAAFFLDPTDHSGLIASLSQRSGSATLTKLSEDPAFLQDLPGLTAIFPQTASGGDLLDAATVFEALNGLCNDASTAHVLVVDMTWCVDIPDVETALEAWHAAVESLCETSGRCVVSVYNRNLLLEAQMQAVLRGHRQFLAASGVYENPFWLPTHLRMNAGVDQQFAYLLGRLVPDYAGVEFLDPDERGFARGANPAWLSRQKETHLSDQREDRWQIRCLGRLRVYQGGKLVKWSAKGSAAHKSRALFCFLLQSGESGVQADRIGELIWPDQADETRKRARLHHAVAMLRQILGGKTTVLRDGEYYRLNAPVGSWTDISAFEQACGRGLALAKQGDPLGALRLYRVAERQYQGDLFEDLPIEYTHNDLDDWCRPRRRWLREMALKLLRDMSIVLRSQGLLDEAFEKCQRALSIDMANEATNIETMRVLHAQARFEAMERQFEQFLVASDQKTADVQNTQFYKIYRRLSG